MGTTVTSFNESNYWLTTTSMPSGTAGKLPASVDVAIIGAGFTGLSAARTLAKRYGMEMTRRMYADSLASIDLVEQIVRGDNIECDFSRCGHLEVACKQSHFDSYARSVDVIAREFGHKLRIIPRSQLQAEI